MSEIVTRESVFWWDVKKALLGSRPMEVTVICCEPMTRAFSMRKNHIEKKAGREINSKQRNGRVYFAIF